MSVSVQAQQQAAQFKKKVTTHGPLTLVPVAQGIVDVFQGTGWSQHSRYRNYKGKWFWLAGIRLEAGALPNA